MKWYSFLGNTIKVDLHCHSHFSDGKHDLTFLAARALENGVTHLAISDHDCVEAFRELEQTDVAKIILADDKELQLIPAVEISCGWETSEIHIVGLCINPYSMQLQKLLAVQQRKRLDRVRRIDEKLQQQGTYGLLSTLQDSSAVALTRSHVADYLVTKGVCANRKKVFKTHLNKKGKLYVPPDWCAMAEAIDAIKNAGGITVLAHPGRYPLNKAKLGRLVGDFQSQGGDALEASYPNISPEMKLYLEQLGEKSSLYLSCGSDFHDAEARWTDVGKFPSLSSNAEGRAVWLHPNWIYETGLEQNTKELDR